MHILMMSHRTKTMLPMAKSLLKPSTATDTTMLRRQRQMRQAAVHDRKAKDVPPLQEGTAVRIRPTQIGQKQWIRGTVTNRATNRSYDVQTPQGTMRRTRVDLRPVPPPNTTRSGRNIRPVHRYGFDP